MANPQKSCEACNENFATVHLTEMANQHIVVEKHLCDACAAKQGVIGKVQATLVSELLGSLKEKQRAAKGEADVKCPDCGMPYAEFRAKARFGCAGDYEVFRKHVEALLEKIHGSTRHVGKHPKDMKGVVPVPAPAPGKPAKEGRAPKKAEEPPKEAAELAALELELERLLKGEEYEKAAKVRDRIKELKGRKESKS